jgi:high-affinity K+ transport system ATPase subunit B
MVFSLLFTPLGRYILIGGLIVMALGGVYFKIRADAVAEIQAAATADALRRTENAIAAGDAVSKFPNRVRDADRNERD